MNLKVVTLSSYLLCWFYCKSRLFIIPEIPFFYWFKFYLKVIEHKPYDQKADVFSFGIALWELLTGEVSTFMPGSVGFGALSFIPYQSYLIVYTIFCNQLPYSCLTPLQAAVGVVQKVSIRFLFANNFVVKQFLVYAWWFYVA